MSDTDKNYSKEEGRRFYIELFRKRKIKKLQGAYKAKRKRRTVFCRMIAKSIMQNRKLLLRQGLWTAYYLFEVLQEHIIKGHEFQISNFIKINKVKQRSYKTKSFQDESVVWLKPEIDTMKIAVSRKVKAFIRSVEKEKNKT